MISLQKLLYFHFKMTAIGSNPPVWASQVLDTLGITQLRPHQLMICKALECKQDFCVVLPTGSGKSLTFQIAPYLRPAGEDTITVFKFNCTVVELLLITLIFKNYILLKYYNYEHIKLINYHGFCKKFSSFFFLKHLLA